jgi:ankyrin repeat protein
VHDVVVCAPLNATGATEAIALAKWLARRVPNPSQPSAAGYPPVFYAVALREYELLHILVAERAVAVDDAGPNPYLPTPLHVLFQLPDERVQLARELLRRNSAAADSASMGGGRTDAAVQKSLGVGDAAGAADATDDGLANHTDAAAPEQFLDGMLYSRELRGLFEGASGEGGALHTLTMAELALAVHSWQLPFLVLLLAHSTDAAALVARTDAWQRNVAHMAARAGNTQAVSMMPLNEEVLSGQDFMGRTALHAAAMHGYASTVRAFLHALESLSTPEARTRVQAIRDKSGMSFEESHPRARPPMAPPPSDGDEDEGRYAPTGGWADTATAAAAADDTERTDGSSSSFSSGVGSKENSGGCAIDVRQDLTAPEFLMQYLVPGRPVLLRGAAAGWDFRSAWSKQQLLQNHGACRRAIFHLTRSSDNAIGRPRTATESSGRRLASSFVFLPLGV